MSKRLLAAAQAAEQGLAAQRKRARTTAGDDGLTRIERRFIEIVMSEDISEITAYMRAAGCSEGAARAGVWRVKSRPEVQRAVIAAANKMIGGATMIAAKRLVKLADSAASEYVQADAAKSLLDRAGITTRQQTGAGQVGGISVTINLGRFENPPDVVIEGHSARVEE